MIFYFFFLAIAIVTTIWACHQNRIRGPEDEPSDITFFLAVIPVPLMGLIGLVILLFNTGVHPFLPLITLALAMVGTSVGLWQINKTNDYETGWGAIAFATLPAWSITWVIIFLVRMFS